MNDTATQHLPPPPPPSVFFLRPPEPGNKAQVCCPRRCLRVRPLLPSPTLSSSCFRLPAAVNKAWVSCLCPRPRLRPRRGHPLATPSRHYASSARVTARRARQHRQVSKNPIQVASCTCTIIIYLFLLFLLLLFLFHHLKVKFLVLFPITPLLFYFSFYCSL